MKVYDTQPNHIGSLARHKRANELLDAVNPDQPIEPEIKKILTDHGPTKNRQNSLPVGMTVTYTLYFTIINMRKGIIMVIPGPPAVTISIPFGNMDHNFTSSKRIYANRICC